MIYYPSGWQHTVHRVFWLRGSTMYPAFIIAILPCVGAALLQCFYPEGIPGTSGESFLKDSQVWGGFSFLVGFLIVFRTSQSYIRFWEGCTAAHQMRAELFDACSSVLAFTKHSKAPYAEIRRFKELLIRLVSMLHAEALAELEKSPEKSQEEHSIGERDRSSSRRKEELEGGSSRGTTIVEPLKNAKEPHGARKYEVIELSIDQDSLNTLRDAEDHVELLFMWIQQMIVENITSGVLSIPPPLLSRTFQELANGMVAFHNACKIAAIPLPFPYAQTCDWLLMMHTIAVPVVTSQWTGSPWSAAIFTLIQVVVLWSLNLVALEIEHPFGTDPNDLDGNRMQEEMNRHLTMLLDPATEKTPHLAEDFQAKSFHELRHKRTISLEAILTSNEADTDAGESVASSRLQPSQVSPTAAEMPKAVVIGEAQQSRRQPLPLGELTNGQVQQSQQPLALGELANGQVQQSQHPLAFGELANGQVHQSQQPLALGELTSGQVQQSQQPLAFGELANGQAQQSQQPLTHGELTNGQAQQSQQPLAHGELTNGQVAHDPSQVALSLAAPSPSGSAATCPYEKPKDGEGMEIQKQRSWSEPKKVWAGGQQPSDIPVHSQATVQISPEVPRQQSKPKVKATASAPARKKDSRKSSRTSERSKTNERLDQ